MKTKNIFIAGLVIVILAISYIWFFVYNKSHTDYQNVEAVYKGDASGFYTEATSGVFTEKYLNQAVEVTGDIAQVESESMLILEPGIICQADSTQSFDGLRKKQSITIKGRAVGTDEDLLTGDLFIRFDNCKVK